MTTGEEISLDHFDTSPSLVIWLNYPGLLVLSMFLVCFPSRAIGRLWEWSRMAGLAQASSLDPEHS